MTCVEVCQVLDADTAAAENEIRVRDDETKQVERGLRTSSILDAGGEEWVFDFEFQLAQFS